MTRPIARYEGPVDLSVPIGAVVTIEYPERRTFERRKAVTRLERRSEKDRRKNDGIPEFYYARRTHQRRKG